LAALLGFAGIVTSGVLSWQTYQGMREQLRQSSDAIAAEQFTTAVEDLSSSDPATRLAGVLFLERIASDEQLIRDHPHYRVDVMVYLEGLLRARSRPGTPGDSETCPKQDAGGVDQVEALSALVNLSRVAHGSGHEVNLAEVCLKFANLSGADLRDANLDSAILEGAILNGTDLDGATLTYSILQGASLDQASLRDAKLMHANLKCAFAAIIDLTGADLQGVYANHVQMPADAAVHAKNVPDGFGTTAELIDPRQHNVGSPGGCVP
jgi:hypothetical protein